MATLVVNVAGAPPRLTTPGGGRQSRAALQAIKQLLHLVLARERGSNASPSAALLAALAAIPTQDLLATIQRQRLETHLHADPLVAELLPQLAPQLQQRARRDTLAALALASLTQEIAALFERADIPLLVIKGVPLALQTTGSLTARGRGDLDLFVNPPALPDAVALLQEQGFVLSNLEATGYTQASALGRYSRWLGYEMSLVRNSSQGRQYIDLHWRLDYRCRFLPDFQQSHARHVVVRIGATSVCTLQLADAFLHACAHAAKDSWMCLRNLVDIHRLAHQLKPGERSALLRLQLVRNACAVTQESTGGPALSVHSPPPPGTAILLQQATRQQLAEWRQQPGPYRSLLPSVLTQYLMLFTADFGPGWGGWKSRAAEFIRLTFPPESLFEPTTGKACLPFGFFFRRVARYLRRVACQQVQ